MAVKVTRIPDLPALLLENVQPFNPVRDTATNMEETVKVKRELGRPVYRIIDIRSFNLTFSDMTVAMGAERDREGGSGDPEVTTCFVGSGALVEIGSKALAQQDQYGKGKVRLFTSVEQAMDFIRKDIEE
jgi:hypothetical protein